MIPRPPVLLAFPIVRCVAAQLIGGIVTVLAISGLRTIELTLPTWLLCLLWGLVAAGASLPFDLRRWWLPVQAVAPILMWLALGADLPAWVFPLIFVVLLGAYWNAVGEGVPLYLTNRTTWQALEQLLPSKPGVRMIDLGSGLGGALLFLAKARPDGCFQGVETAPLVFFVSRLRLLMSGLVNLRIGFRSIWRTDLSDFDVVYCFLSPVPMARLFSQAQREMKSGALFVSNSFEVQDHQPDEVVQLDDGRETRLLIWRM